MWKDRPQRIVRGSQSQPCPKSGAAPLNHTTAARPATASTGTGPKIRLLRDRARMSPRRNTIPGGTTISPSGPPPPDLTTIG